MGILLGLKFRIASVIAASLGLAILVAAMAAIERWEPIAALKIGFLSLLSLQFAYLLGLMLSGLYRRAGGDRRRPHPALHPAVDADRSRAFSDEVDAGSS